MARKNKKKQPNAPQKKPSSRSRQAAEVGVVAILLGALTWLFGGFSWQNALDWIKTLAIAGGIALTFRWSIGEPYKIPSGSMEPTLHGDPGFMRGDRVFVNKWIYGLRFPFNHARIPFTGITIHYADRRLRQGAKPQRFDIVVFKSVEKNAQHGTLVKRVIGLPGERVHIEHGKVLINGEPLNLPGYTPDVYYTSPGGWPSDMRYGIDESDRYSVVPEGHYFLLGDNSDHSKDGRYWGWVPNEHILGRVSCIAWPPTRIHDFTGFSKTWWWRATVCVLGLLLFWRLLFGRSWRVRGASPDSSLATGDHLYINRFAFGFPLPFSQRRLTRGRASRRGELVLYCTAPDEAGHVAFLLGRVAGLPGERVFLDDGVLCIDDKKTDDPLFTNTKFPTGESTGPYGRSKTKEYSLVPKDHFFLLSENPDIVPDSRTLGWIPRQNLTGPATAVWWPPSRWRWRGR